MHLINTNKHSNFQQEKIHMASNQLFPGIYGKEIDKSQVAQYGREGDIGLFIGDSRRGPIGKNTFLTSTEQFVSLFGSPAYDSSDFTSIAAFEYLNRSGPIYFTRVRDTDKDHYSYSTFSDTNITGSSATSASTYTKHAITDGANDTVMISAKELANISKNIFFNISLVGKSVTNSLVLSDLQDDFTDKIYKVSIFENEKVKTGHIITGEGDVVPYVTAGSYFSDDTLIEYHYVTFMDHRELAIETGFGTDLFIENVINKNSNIFEVSVSDNIKTNAASSKIPFVSGSYYQLTPSYLAEGSKIISQASPSGVEEILRSYKNKDNYDIDLVVDTHVDKPIDYYTNLIEDRKDLTAVLFVKDFAIDNSGNTTPNKSSIGVSFNTSESSTYGIAYPMWGKMYLPYLKKEVWIPSNIMAVNNIVSTARDNNISYAPAGEKRGGLPFSDMRYVWNTTTPKQYSDDELGTAYTTTSYNMSIFRRNLGWFLWGQRTLTTDNVARRDIHVRRTLNKIKKTVTNYLKEFLFEPATDSTRSKIFTKLDGYFSLLKSPSSQILIDYGLMVVNDPLDIDNGVQRIKIYVKFPRTIEKINFEINITSSGVNISEIV